MTSYVPDRSDLSEMRRSLKRLGLRSRLRYPSGMGGSDDGWRVTLADLTLGSPDIVFTYSTDGTQTGSTFVPENNPVGNLIQQAFDTLTLENAVPAWWSALLVQLPPTTDPATTGPLRVDDLVVVLTDIRARHGNIPIVAENMVGYGLMPVRGVATVQVVPGRDPDSAEPFEVVDALPIGRDDVHPKPDHVVAITESRRDGTWLLADEAQDLAVVDP